jgi:amino acid transporter
MRNGLLVVVLLLKLAKQASKVLVRFLLPSSALSDSFVCLLFLSFFSTKNSSTFNLVMTVLHIAFVLFIIVAGFAKGDVRNLTIAAASAGGAAATDSANGGGGFAPFGMRGIFNGAAIVYFSYIGYDAVSTTAEEVKNPAKNMTIGLSGSVIAVTILYCFIALALCMLQPFNLVSRRKILRAKLLLVLCILESSSCSLSAAHHLCLFVCLSERERER